MTGRRTAVIIQEEIDSPARITVYVGGEIVYDSYEEGPVNE